MTNATSTRPFKVGDRVKHLNGEYGIIKDIDIFLEPSVITIEVDGKRYKCFESSIELAEPAFKYGDEVEACMFEDFSHKFQGEFICNHPQKGFIILVESGSEPFMDTFWFIRPIPKPVDPREVLSNEITRQLDLISGRQIGTGHHYEAILKAVDTYLAAERERWEREVQKIMPTDQDYFDQPRDLQSFFRYCDTPEGQAWLKARRGEGK